MANFLDASSIFLEESMATLVAMMMFASKLSIRSSFCMPLFSRILRARSASSANLAACLVEELPSSLVCHFSPFTPFKSYIIGLKFIILWNDQWSIGHPKMKQIFFLFNMFLEPWPSFISWAKMSTVEAQSKTRTVGWLFISISKL